VVRFTDETRHKRTHGEDLAKLRWLDRHLGHLMLDQVTPDLLAAIRADLTAGNGPQGGKSQANANRYLSLVRNVLRRAALDWQWLDQPPPIRLASERGSGGFLWLTREKAQQLLEQLAPYPHTADMVRFSLATGLREFNVTGLTWSSVDLSRRVAWVDASLSKTRTAISVPLNDDAVAVLRRWRFKHKERVFVYRGQPIAVANTKVWRDALEAQGLRPHKGRHPENFRWHDLRHTWASWHVQAGTPLEVLQRLGGWASLDMVLRYAHLAPGHIAAFAENSGTKLTQKSGGKKKRAHEGPVTD
jgi:integrase